MRCGVLKLRVFIFVKVESLSEDNKPFYYRYYKYAVYTLCCETDPGSGQYLEFGGFRFYVAKQIVKLWIRTCWSSLETLRICLIRFRMYLKSWYWPFGGFLGFDTSEVGAAWICFKNCF